MLNDLVPPTPAATAAEPTWAKWTRRGLMYGVALATGTLGFLSFFGWFLVDVTPGLLPNWLVAWGADLSPALQQLRLTHLLLGFSLLAAYVWYGFAWYNGYIASPFTVAGRSATAAFYAWFFGLFFTRRREYRPRFRDSLEYPRMELATAIAIAGITAMVFLIPFGVTKEIALGLHRINALYFFFLAGYALLVLALRRRGPSPWPKAPSSGPPKAAVRPTQPAEPGKGAPRIQLGTPKPSSPDSSSTAPTRHYRAAVVSARK